jgi:hypothetical protein
MTATMKPRQIFSSNPAEIQVGGQWYSIGTVTLIGSRKWTIRDTDGAAIVQCSGNDSFTVR